MMMVWWGLQTVMILLEHFENQYCSTRLLVFPPLPSTPPSPLPPCLPPSLLHPNRLWADSPCWDCRTRWGSVWGWDWLRCKLREWEAVRQQTVCGCHCVVLGTDPSNSLSHPPLSGGTSGGKTLARLPLSHKYVFFPLWLTLWGTWDYWLHHSHHHHHRH